MKMNNVDALAAEAEGLLMCMPRVSWIARGKRAARQYLLHELVEPIDDIPWSKGCLLAGLAQAGKYDTVRDYFDLWLKKGAKLYTVDNILAGQALLLMTDSCARRQSGDDSPCSLRQLRQHEMQEHAMMGFLYAHAKDEEGSLPYRPLHGTGHIYADGIGMICPYAVGYGVKYRDSEAVKLAMKQFRNFLKNGMDETTGLPYHAYCLRSGTEPEKLGAIGWGRAAGWILYGLGMSLQFLYKAPELFEKERSELTNLTRELVKTVLSYRNEEGLFGSILCDSASPTDTSGSAMILHGMRMLKEETYRTACGQSMEALQKYCQNGKVLQAQSECIALGTYGTQYESFPWSVGMTLSLLVLS